MNTPTLEQKLEIKRLQLDLVPASHPSDGRLIFLNKNRILWIDYSNILITKIHMDNGDMFYGYHYAIPDL